MAAAGYDAKGLLRAIFDKVEQGYKIARFTKRDSIDTRATMIEWIHEQIGRVKTPTILAKLERDALMKGIKNPKMYETTEYIGDGKTVVKSEVGVMYEGKMYSITEAKDKLIKPYIYIYEFAVIYYFLAMCDNKGEITSNDKTMVEQNFDDDIRANVYGVGDSVARARKLYLNYLKNDENPEGKVDEVKKFFSKLFG